MQWAPAYGFAVYALAALGALAGLYLARRVAVSDGLRSLWLFVPRLGALMLVLLVLLNPVRESTRQLPARRPQVACLIDASRSMGLDRPVTRLAEAQQFVQRGQLALDQADGAQLQLYRFGARFSSLPSLADLGPNDERSRLGQAMRSLAGLWQERPKAVVVLSDGQIDDADELRQLARDYRNLGTAVHVVPIGNEAIQGDIAIERLAVPRGVNPGDQVPVRVTVRSQGFDGYPVRLQVRPARSAAAEPVAELPITLVAGSQSYDLVVPADRSAGELLLSVPVQPDEAIASNNQVPFQLLPRDRRIRVLYMEGSIQGVEYTFVRDALQDDPNIECVSMLVDNQYASRPRLARVDDPYRGFPATRNELFEFDVVICSDISRGAFTREQLDWTAELVRERGGGFVMVGGHTSFGAGGWDQTVWDQLIPIDMRGGQIGRGFINQQFRVSIPAAAMNHPIWRIVEDPERNRQILEAMPPFYGTNLAQRLKPAATLLGESAGRLTVAGQTPIFACQAYGRGRTFAMLTDTTEAWGYLFEHFWGENDNRHFRKFWRNVVLWLTENSVSAQSRLVVETDKLIYRPGEPIELTAQAYDEDFQPTTAYTVQVAMTNAPDSAAGATRLTVSADKYRGTLTAVLPAVGSDVEATTLMPSVLRVTVLERGNEVLSRDLPVQILNDSDELLTPNPRRDTLVELAETTGGQVLESAYDLRRVLGDLPSLPGRRAVHRSPLWDHPAMWLSMLGLVVSEWIMRRRGWGRQDG
jgi:uncharacterized membrane protein